MVEDNGSQTFVTFPLPTITANKYNMISFLKVKLTKKVPI